MVIRLHVNIWYISAPSEASPRAFTSSAILNSVKMPLIYMSVMFKYFTQKLLHYFPPYHFFAYRTYYAISLCRLLPISYESSENIGHAHLSIYFILPQIICSGIDSRFKYVTPFPKHRQNFAIATFSLLAKLLWLLLFTFISRAFNAFPPRSRWFRKTLIENLQQSH